MNTKPFYHTKVTTVLGQLTVEQAAQIMREFHVGDVVVVEELTNGRERPIGILTDRDIVMEVVAAKVPCNSLKVSDIMTPNPIVASSTMNPLEMLTLMRVNGVKRLPIVDDEETLVGIISSEDLLTLSAEWVSQLSKISGKRMKIEKSERPFRLQTL